MSKPYGILGAGRFLHGGDYNPDQWLKTPEYIDDDFRLMRESGCNTFSIGIFAWTSYEKKEGVFTFDWLDRIMDRMAEEGHNVILATPSGAKPSWMAHKYPEIRRVDRLGLREPVMPRHNHCWTSPVFREKVHTINTELATRYKDHPALKMWHISNEYSGECYCDLCLARWHQWLEEKYGSLDNLNDLWWGGFWSETFTDWREIDPRNTAMDSLEVDWHRFTNFQLADFFQWEAIPLRKITPNIPCTTNFMGANEGLDYSTIAEVVDIVTDDQYPCFYIDDPDLVKSAVSVSFKDDLFRCFKPDRPWMLMESCPDATQWRLPKRLKRPGVHHAEMLQAIGHGAEGTCYFQWRAGRGSCEKFHGAVVDHSNSSETRVFQTVADLSKKYEKLTGILGTDIKSDVAIIYDWDCKWGFRHSGGMPSDNYAYDRNIQDHYRTFWEQGISVDIFRSERDFSGYKLVIAPILWMLKEGVAERIKAYVEAGGIFVMTYCSGVADETNRVLMGGLPGGGLREFFGLWNEEIDVLDPGSTVPVVGVAGNELGLGTLNGLHVRAVSHLEGATPLATYSGDFYAGSPAITVNHVGKGKAIYVGALLDVAGLRDLYGPIVASLGLEKALDGTAPKTVATQKRGDYVLLENFSNEPATVILTGKYVNVLTDEPAGAELVLEPAGSAVLVAA